MLDPNVAPARNRRLSAFSDDWLAKVVATVWRPVPGHIRNCGFAKTYLSKVRAHHLP
jgi:hypothetical protein